MVTFIYGSAALALSTVCFRVSSSIKSRWKYLRLSAAFLPLLTITLVPLLVQLDLRDSDFSGISFRYTDPPIWRLDTHYRIQKYRNSRVPVIRVKHSCPPDLLPGIQINEGSGGLDGCRTVHDPWKNETHSLCCLRLGTVYQQWPDVVREGRALVATLYGQNALYASIPILTIMGVVLIGFWFVHLVASPSSANQSTHHFIPPKSKRHPPTSMKRHPPLEESSRISKCEIPSRC
jgi:hypothetical protein